MVEKRRRILTNTEEARQKRYIQGYDRMVSGVSRHQNRTHENIGKALGALRNLGTRFISLLSARIPFDEVGPPVHLSDYSSLSLYFLREYSLSVRVIQ